jgi:putative membrane protein
MISTEKHGFVELLKYSLPYFVYCFLYAFTVMFIEEYVGDHIYKSSGQIGSVFGIVVAFLISFRINSAYDRWWEGRKIAGELVNNSRALSSKIISYNKNREKIYEICNLLKEYIKQLKSQIYKENTNHELNKASIILLNILKKIDNDFDKSMYVEKNDLINTINNYYNIQGKMERIANTPFLKIYGAFTKVVIFCYVIMIPFFIGDIDIGGEKSNLEYISIIIVSFIGTIFLTINKLANLYGEPFSRNILSIPLESICNKIEREIDELLKYS